MWQYDCMVHALVTCSRPTDSHWHVTICIVNAHVACSNDYHINFICYHVTESIVKLGLIWWAMKWLLSDATLALQ